MANFSVFLCASPQKPHFREFTNVCKYSVNICNFMRYVFTIVCSKWGIRQDFTTDNKLSKFSVNAEAILPEVYMPSKFSNILASFTCIVLYCEMLTLTCVFTYVM